MARLIDANELVKLLKANTMSNGTLINTNTMLAVVEKMPTAYDVEKVVEELGTRQDDIQVDVSLHDFYIQGYSSAIDYANDIVIKGGVE